jgi:hypothetical protein
MEEIGRLEAEIAAAAPDKQVRTRRRERRKKRKISFFLQIFSFFLQIFLNFSSFCSLFCPVVGWFVG